MKFLTKLNNRRNKNIETTEKRQYICLNKKLITKCVKNEHKQLIQKEVKLFNLNTNTNKYK